MDAEKENQELISKLLGMKKPCLKPFELEYNQAIDDIIKMLSTTPPKAGDFVSIGDEEGPFGIVLTSEPQFDQYTVAELTYDGGGYEKWTLRVRKLSELYEPKYVPKEFEEKDKKDIGLCELTDLLRPIFENEKFIGNVCLSKRHDFGLLDEKDRETVAFGVKETFRAILNNLPYHKE